MAVLGCTPYRIEHRERPSFYKSASAQELPNEVVLEDGTILRFSEQKAKHTGAAAGVVDALATEKIQIRQQTPDGKITLRAYAPEHVTAQSCPSTHWMVAWRQACSPAHSTSQF